MSFEELGLPPGVLRGVTAVGYTEPTPIQAQAIPPALRGRDVIGRAQTGTGKTAAFALPILARFELTVAGGGSRTASPENAPSPTETDDAPRPRRGRRSSTRRHSPSSDPAVASPPVRALVITPTRELAVQIDEAFAEYGQFMGVRTVTVYGGVQIEKQFRKLERGVDVVIATPGRLLDHVGRGSVDLSQVEVFVIDEADRMFDMGFIKDVRRIIAELPKDRQTFLFSATISSEVKRLAERIQKDPVLIEVGEQRNPIETVTQHVYPVQGDRKFDLLKEILDKQRMDMVLVFCSTKDGADYVTRRLVHHKIDAAQIHSNLSQRERQQALEGFKNGEHQVLVATDIAARGLDIDGISHVVNFDVPRYAEDYIHRIGRTGRAHATGDAITFVGYDEEEFLRRIEEYIGQKFERKTFHDFDHGVVKLDKPPESVQRLTRSGGSRRSGKRRYV